MGHPTMNTRTGPQTSPPTPIVRRATEDDVDQLGLVIAAAFTGLTQNDWLVTDTVAQHHLFPKYFGLQVDLGVTAGIVHTTVERDAVAVWFPVLDGALPTLPDYDDRLAEIAGNWTGRFHAFENALAAHHPVGIPHHFLAFLAVDPPRQRAGVGTTLLRHHLPFLDQQGLPAYLDAATEDLYGFYGKHDWQPRRSPYPVADDGPFMHPMWRPAVRRPPSDAGGITLPRLPDPSTT